MSNAHRIRFAEYTDDWELRKVSNVAEITAGGTPSTSIENYWEPKEVPWLSSGEVHKKYISFTDNQISIEGMNHSSAKIIKENSVLIALAGQGKTRGTVAINRIPLTTNQSIAAMSFDDDIVPEFVLCNLDNRYDEIRKMSSGDGVRGGLNKRIIGDIVIPYTSKKEQEKIGHFFNNFDSLITLYQHEYEKLVSLKSACLDKMFPKNGNKVPELRFSEFTGNWRQLKLGNIASITTGSLDANAATENGNYAFFTCGKEMLKTNTYAFEGNAILISGNGDLGFTRRYSGKFDAYQRTYVLQNFIENYVFVEQSIHRYLPERLKIESFGGTMPYIKRNTLSELLIYVPEEGSGETDFISKFLTGLDNLISLYQCKLGKIKQFKQAILHNMFV